MNFFNWNASQNNSQTINTKGYTGWAQANITTSSVTINFHKQSAENLFSKYYPIFQEFNSTEPTFIEVNNVYLKIIESIENLIPNGLPYEKKLERNKAIFNLIKGNSTLWLVYSKSEDEFVSNFAQLFLKHIQI